MPRGERGGKKTKKSKELAEATIRGEHVPKSAPSSSSGLERLRRVSERDASKALNLNEPKAAPDSVVPVVTSETRSLPKSVVTSEIRSVPARAVPKAVVAPVTPPKVAGTPSEFVEVAVEPEFPDFEPRDKPRLSEAVPEKLGKPVVKPPKPVAPFVASSVVPGIPQASSVVASSSSQGFRVPPKKRPAEPPFESSASKPKSVVREIPKPPASAPSSVAKTIGVAPAIQEYRVSIDFNKVLNVQQAGDAEFRDGIHPVNVQLLRDFIGKHVDRGVRVGVTSYIGQFGNRSQARRSHLTEVVRAFNRDQPNFNSRLGLRILDTRKKSLVLNHVGTAVHIDDTLECLDSCDNTIETYWVTRARHHNRHYPVDSLRSALQWIEQGRFSATLQTRTFESCWVVL